MEQHVWLDERVLKILKEEVVHISLYVDDKRTLPERDQVESKLYREKDYNHKPGVARISGNQT